MVHRMDEKKCPKCNGVMEAVKLFSQGAGTLRWGKSIWQVSSPEVIAYRCEKCGYIELYAE